MKMINEILLNWYKENKRDLPWRQNKDPYAIWVSEIMLQQTRVEAVKPYYHRFMKRLPNIMALAYCEEDELYKLWEGLGYYSRVRNMKKAALICVEKYDALLPKSYDELLELPGIGPYTAAAIASIAYNEVKVAMDGNVMRVFSRLLNIQEEINTKTAQDKIYSYFEDHPCEQMGELNQAIMDFGNAICLPKEMLRCNICPLREECEGYKCHTARLLPYKKAKKARRKEKYTVVIYRCGNKVLLHKRDEKGLLAGLYEYTTLCGHYTKKDFDRAIYLGKYKHIFSHVEWHMKGFLVPCEEMKEEGIWVDIEDMMSHYSIPGAFAFYRDLLLNMHK